MRSKLAMVLGLLVLLLGTDQVLTQQGGGRKGGGKGGFDFFDKMAGGKEVWIRAEADPNRQQFFDRVAQSLGVTNGQITREQFNTWQEQMKGAFGGKGKRGGGGPPQGPGQPGPGPGGPGGGKKGGGGGPQPGETFDQYAERSFKRRDLNGDGFLNMDEASRMLRDEFARWDKNKDGLISFDEYKAYLKDFEERRAASRLRQQYADSAMNQAEQDLDRRPMVYRAGSLPLDKLPPWFAQLDTDKDGQVGLYEWRQAGKPLQEFLAMDRNNDGFLTVEEVLYYQEALAKKEGGTATTQVVSNYGRMPPPTSVSAAYPQSNGDNPWQGFGKGKKGGKGGKGGKGKKGKKGGDFEP